jgi:hypothetical protein
MMYSTNAEKSQLKALHNVDHTEMTKSNEVSKFALFTTSDLHFFLFLHCLEYKVFRVKILHVCSIIAYI